MYFTGIDVVDHIIASIILCVGLISCFCGYRLFKFFLALAGFLFTLLIVFTVIYYFISPSLIIASVVGSVVGIAGAFGISFLPALGVFSLGSFFGFTLSLVLIALAQIEYMQQDDVRDVIMLALSVLVGFLSLYWKKVTVLVGTSLLGSFSVITSIDHWANTGFIKLLDNVLKYNTTQTPVGGPLIAIIITFFATFALGLSLQYFITGRLDEQDLSVSGQLPITIPRANCCNPYVSLFHKKVRRDEVPLLDVVALEDY